MVTFGHLKFVEGWQIYSFIYVQFLYSHLGKDNVLSAVVSLCHFSHCKEPLLLQFGDYILQGNTFCCGGHHDVTFYKAEHE